MRRALLIGAPVAAVLIAAAVAAFTLQPWRPAAAESTGEDDAATAIAERTSLTSELVLNGNLSYGEELNLPGGGGTITRLPKAGDVISVGQAVYEVNGRPVIAVRGDRPFWRTLGEGMTDGADVQQLEQALTDFGFGADITVDTEFTWNTAEAVKDWQEALGIERTGVVELGDIVAVPAASIRISAVNAALGDQAGPASLSYTSTALRVVAKLTDAQAREILPATAVIVTLPDGTELPATIVSIDPGGEPEGDQGETTPASATIEFEDATAAAGLGLRAVKVALAAETVDDALVIPKADTVSCCA